MTTSVRKATNSPFWQGVDEEIAYKVDTASWEGYDSGEDAEVELCLIYGAHSGGVWAREQELRRILLHTARV